MTDYERKILFFNFGGCDVRVSETVICLQVCGFSCCTHLEKGHTHQSYLHRWDWCAEVGKMDKQTKESAEAKAVQELWSETWGCLWTLFSSTKAGFWAAPRLSTNFLFLSGLCFVGQTPANRNDSRPVCLSVCQSGWGYYQLSSYQWTWFHCGTASLDQSVQPLHQPLHDGNTHTQTHMHKECCALLICEL